MGQRHSHGRSRVWPLVLTLIAITLALGSWGFDRLPVDNRLSFGQSLYHAAKLFALDLGPAGGGVRGGGLNWQIVVAAVIADLLVLRALLSLGGDRLRRWFMRRHLTGHVVVCGGGVHGSRLAYELARDHDVVVADADASAPGLQVQPGTHKWPLVGDAVQEKTLLAAGVQRASWVVAVTGDSFVNSQIVSAIHTLDRIPDCLHVMVQVEDPSLARFLEEGEASAAPTKGERGRSGEMSPESLAVVTPFSPNAIAAEVLLEKARCKRAGGPETPLLRMREGKAPHLILAGDDPLLDAIILAALRRWRVRMLRSLEAGLNLHRPPLRISVYGPGAVDRIELLRRRWRPESSVLEIEAKDVDPTTAREIEQDEWLRDRRHADHAILACTDELTGVRLTLEISRALGNDVLMTRITTQPRSVLDAQLQERTAESATLATTTVEALAELAYDRDEMSIDARQRLANVLAAAPDADRDLAERTADELFSKPELGLHSDSTFRVMPAERALLQALVAPVPVSALVRARLAVDYESAANLRTAAERLTRAGREFDAFTAWCEYARRVTAESPDDLRAGLERLPGDEIGDAILRLRGAALDTGTAAQSLPRETGVGSHKWRVTIFAGAAASMSPEANDALQHLLPRALWGYEGLVFSGGTSVGLPGVIGEIARRLGLSAVGYAPGGQGDRDLYPTVRETPGSREFSVRQPLAMWADILSAGIPVEDVRVVACPGGPITHAEILLARTLGAPVAWLDPAGDADLPLHDMLPFGADGVIELPVDAMTLRAFIRWTTAPEELRDHVARFIHASYRRKQRGRKPPGDPALAPWEQLLPALQRSNLHQANDIPNKLAAVGKRLAKSGGRLKLSDNEIELLAEMEHGRFSLERLTGHWQLGQRRVWRLVSPYLKPWHELDEAVKEYNREAVRNIAAALASAAWGVETAKSDAKRELVGQS